MAAKRPTKLEEDARHDTIRRWMGEGLLDSQLLYRIIEHFELSESAARRTLVKVYALVHAQNLENIPEQRAEALNRLTELFQRAFAAKEYATAAKIEVQIAKLIGTNAPERKDVTVTEVKPILSELIDEESEEK